MSERQIIATDLAHALAEAETAIDQALMKSSRLLALLPEMRTAAGLSAVVGQPVFAAAARAGAHLVDARGAMVEGHNGLEALRRAMRLDPVVGTTPVDKPEEETPRQTGVVRALQRPAA